MNNDVLKTLVIAAALVISGASLASAGGASHSREAQAARADITKTLGFVPGFLDAMPDAALPGAWAEMKGLQLNPSTALPGRVKELIGLAVASQIPCKYCIYAHDQFAKLNGASAAEVGEAVGVA